MPMIMSLEGPRLRPIDRVRGQLYAATPRAAYRAGAQLRGIFDPLRAHSRLAIGCVLLGMWLAGTGVGQELVRKARGPRRK